LTGADLRRLAAPYAVAADIRGMWRHTRLPPDLYYWRL
jgi:hypothetical protein